MGESDSTFEGGMSEMRSRSLGEEQEELRRIEEEHKQRQFTNMQQRARAMATHAEETRKRMMRIKRLRRLRYIRCFGCCFGSAGMWLLIVGGAFLLLLGGGSGVAERYQRAVDSARAASPAYDRTITGIVDLACRITGEC